MMSSETSERSAVIVDDHVESIHNEADPSENGNFDPYLVQFDKNDPANPKVRLHRKLHQLTD